MHTLPILPSQIKSCAASCVIIKSDEVLLFLRDDMPMWTNIGGNLDAGEDFIEALHRETMEETGCKIKIKRFVGDFFSPLEHDCYNHEKVYLAELEENQMPQLQDNEGVKLQFFNKDNLPINMSPRFRQRILAALSGNQQPVAQIVSGDNMIEFLRRTKDFTQFVGIDDWLYHPTVQRKRIEDKLKFDLLPLMSVIPQ